MDNTLWHFGDSFGCWGNAPKGFSEYLSEYYGLNFEHYSIEGNSNQQILTSVIDNLSKIKKGDFLLFNWSFFERIVYLNQYMDIKNTNNILTSPDFKGTNETLTEGEVNPYSPHYFNFVINQKTDFAFFETILLFKSYVLPLFKYFKEVGISYCSCFISNTLLKSPTGNNEFDVERIFGTSINKVHWSNSEDCQNEYLGFLNRNNLFKDGEDVHYKFGIQKELANEWLKRIDCFYKK